MKLRTQFVAICLGVVLAGSLLILSWTYVSARQRMIANFKDNILNFSTSIHDAILRFMETGDQTLLDRYMEDVAKMPSVEEANIARSENFEKSLGSKTKKPADEDYERQALESGTEIIREIRYKNRIRSISRVSPVIATGSCLACHPGIKEGETIAALCTTISYQGSYDRMIFDIFKTGFGQILFILLVAFFILLYFKRAISNPIERLQKDAELVGAGNMDHRFTVKARDEIGQLASAFDQMRRSLKDARQNLEKRVADRTAELTVALRESDAAKQSAQKLAEEVRKANRQLEEREKKLAKEIIERWQVEKKLKETNYFQSALLAGAGSAIISTDEKGAITSFNETAERMLGYKAAELVGLATPEVFHDKNEVISRAAEFSAEMNEKIVPGFEVFVVRLRKNLPNTFEWTYLAKDGRQIPVLLTVTALRDDEDHILGFLGIATDISALRKAQEELKESENRHRDLYELSADAMMQYSPTRGILDGNIACLKLFRCRDKAEFVSKKLGDFSPSHQPDGTESAVKSGQMMALAMAQGAHTFEWVHKDLGGKEFYASILLTKIEQKGEPILQATIRDVTLSKLAETALCEERAKLNAITSSAKEAIVMIDPVGNISFWNRAAEEMFGYSGAEILGKNLHATLAPVRFLGAFETGFESFKASGKGEAVGKTLELAALRKDGTEFPVELSLSAIQLNEQWYGVGIMRDVTERVQKDKRLRQLSRAVEQSPSSVVITNLGGAIEYVNPKFTEVTGYSLEEARGQNPRILKSGETNSEVYKELWASISSGREWRGELHNKKKNGELYWEFASISPIRNSKGEITNYLAVKEDITELKTREEQTNLLLRELQAARAASEAATRTKSQFVANMSHEIRTPMNAILGFLDLLRGTQLNDQQKDYLETIASSGEVLLAIINDILDLSKIEEGKLKLEHIDFNLDHLAEDVIRMIRPKIESKPVILSYRIAENVPHNLNGDPTRVRQLLLNFLSNALKFTDKGEVSLEVVLEEGPWQEGKTHLRFSVSDTGIGIPADKQEQIFVPFVQADMSTTRKYGGTGLGLSICRNIVEMMGGRIWVESEVGKGSRFIFTAPFEEGHGVAETEIYPIAAGHLKGRKVLVVDDLPKARQILFTICQEYGMAVSEAASAAEATEFLSKASERWELPEIAILDIMMPETDGYSLARQIKSRPEWSGMKIVAATSDVRVGLSAELSRVGFDAFLPKPITKREFVSVLKTVLGDKRSGGQIITRHTASEFACKGLKVLVAEDNPFNQKLMMMRLKSFGCEAEFADNGAEAVEKVKAKSYDLCLMDLQMPVMGGLQATEMIRRELSKDLPIIALTAAVLEEDREKCTAAGMNGFLGKPVKAQELKDILIKCGRREG
jgi:PAS domain S-box-containing protein